MIRYNFFDHPSQTMGKILHVMTPRLIGAIILLLGIGGFGDLGRCEGWDDIKIRLLPDTSFAVIEYDIGRSVRHCPHHDLNGKLDIEQLIYVLGTLGNEKWVTPFGGEAARKHLEKHYNSFLKEQRKKKLPNALDINKAKLSELVSLPIIGPVLAVKIVEYRSMHRQFQSIEEVRKVDGIGPGIFAAVRHYIRAD